MRAVVQVVASASVRAWPSDDARSGAGSDTRDDARSQPSDAAGSGPRDAGRSGPGEVVGGFDEPGLAVLVGVTHDDTPEQADRLAEKIWQLRILDDERSASDVGAPVLVVSQFTLYADLRKGRRPSWSAAAPRPVSEPLVTAFCDALRARDARVEVGVFGADMQVSLVNDGPRTIIIEM